MTRRRRLRVLWLAIIALAAVPLAVSTRASAQAAPLTLDEVLQSAAEHHPRVRAALAGVDAAESDLRAARGAFDPRANVRAYLRRGGYYDLLRVDGELRAVTPFWGAEFWAGYRLGQPDDSGNYPTYYSDETLDRGEVRVGASLPLLRGRAMDSRRAARARARSNR